MCGFWDPIHVKIPKKYVSIFTYHTEKNLMTIAGKIIRFYENLRYTGNLPSGIAVMNPFAQNPSVMEITREFYSKFYSDQVPRRIILGINPGRHGAGTTGIPFTDSIRLEQKCGISARGLKTHEPSSAFIYDMIDQFGGVEKFYGKLFLSAICPLGFTIKGKREGMVNYNYYDSPELLKAVQPFILETLQQQIAFGIDTSVCYCLGTGKNERFLRKINQEHHFFDRITALEHPRFILQYRAKRKGEYIQKYIEHLTPGP
jgi:hypothetical protein